MRIFRGLTVFALCAIASLLILNLVLYFFSLTTPRKADQSELVFLNLFFLPIIIGGGVVFGGLLYLISQPGDRAKLKWFVSRGAISGAIYSALVMIAFGALVPLALVYVAAGGLAGALSGFLWCRLIEQKDV